MTVAQKWSPRYISHRRHEVKNPRVCKKGLDDDKKYFDEHEQLMQDDKNLQREVALDYQTKR